MSNERDQGLSAIQRGDYDVAATLLETACRENPDDFQAHLYLGGAYHQLKRSNDAVRVLVRATQLQPASAQARYNLGIALEQAGRHVEAVASLQNALALQPDYPAAQQAIQRLLTATAPFQSSGNPDSMLPLNSSGTYNPSAQSLNLPGGYGQPNLYGGQSNVGASGYLPRNTGAAGYQPGSYQPTLNSAYEDSFDIVQAFKDIFRILISPTRFFSEQTGCEGMRAPFAMLAIFMALKLIGLVGGFLLNSVPVDQYTVSGFIIGGVMVVAGYLILAGVVHLVGLLFGNSAAFSGSFRATIYAFAPFLFISITTTVLAPVLSRLTADATPVASEHRMILAQYSQSDGNSTSSSITHQFKTRRTSSTFGVPKSPLLSMIYLFLMIWCLVLYCVAVHFIQRISVGGAIATVIIASVIDTVVLIVMFVLIMGIVMAVTGGGA